jgi:hypothetical protein
MPKSKTEMVAKWGTQRPKTDIEWAMHRASQLPGPGEYENTGPMRKNASFAFSKHNPKGQFEWIEYYASQLPGPADYGPAHNAPRKRSLKTLQHTIAEYRKPGARGQTVGKTKSVGFRNTA